VSEGGSEVEEIEKKTMMKDKVKNLKNLRAATLSWSHKHEEEFGT